MTAAFAGADGCVGLARGRYWMAAAIGTAIGLLAALGISTGGIFLAGLLVGDLFLLVAFSWGCKALLASILIAAAFLGVIAAFQSAKIIGSRWGPGPKSN